MAELALHLFQAIPKRIIKEHTVTEALVARCWVTDIRGGSHCPDSYRISPLRYCFVTGIWWDGMDLFLVQSQGGTGTSHVGIFAAYACDSCPSKSRGRGQPRWDGARCAHEGRKKRPLPTHRSRVGAPGAGEAMF